MNNIKIIFNLLTIVCLKKGYFVDGSSIRCYSCVSALQPETDAEAKVSAKKFFESNFNLPRVVFVCNDPKDLSFVTVDKVECRDSVCTTISVLAGEERFTIRGCKSTIHKTPPPTSSQCNVANSPSYCDCSTELCNIGNASHGQLLLILIFFIALVLNVKIVVL